MGNRFVKYIGSVWHRACLCVKVLIVAVVLFVFSQAVEFVSFYINVNSGGIETTSGKIFLWCFYGFMAFLLLFFVLIPISFIAALIKFDEPINILLTIISVTLAVMSFGGSSYLQGKIRCQSEPDTLRCVISNMGKSEALRKFGLNLNLAKNDKDLVFTHNWLEQNLTGTMLPYTNGKFVLNSNLMNKKLSQLPDNVVVIFESNIPYDKGNIGDPNDISTWWHYGRGSLMVFGDGRVEFVKTEDFNNLQWQP